MLVSLLCMQIVLVCDCYDVWERGEDSEMESWNRARTQGQLRVEEWNGGVEDLMDGDVYLCVFLADGEGQMC